MGHISFINKWRRGIEPSRTHFSEQQLHLLFSEPFYSLSDCNKWTWCVPATGCGCMLGLLKLSLESVCAYLPIFVCPYEPANVRKFLSGKCTLYTQNKSQKNPTITFCASKLWLEGGFFLKLKTACGKLPQASSLAFIITIYNWKTPKQACLAHRGEIRISSFKKWVWPVLTQTKIELPLLKEFSKNDATERL